MARLELRILSAMITVCASLGCGGVEKSPAETPPSPTEPAQAAGKSVEPPEATSSPAAEAEAEPTHPPETADEAAKEDESFKPERPPLEFLTDKKLSFETNFSASEIGIKTDERCKEENGGDMRAYAECKKQVSARLGLRVLRFVEKGGAWWYLVYSKQDQGKSSHLALLHKVMCKFGERTDNTITIELIGKDEMKTGEKLRSKFVITVPNNYSIDLSDPEYGRMNYTAKYGNIPGEEK